MIEKEYNKILAIVPARGGSKRLPRKNILDLCGKPLIAWTIEQALECSYIDRVIVSTDDEEIAEVSREYGADVPFLRPKDLASDDSPTIDTVIHAINFLESKNDFFDIIIILEPTSPLRSDDDLDQAIKHFFENFEQSHSLVSVGKVHLEDPHIMKKIDSGHVEPFIDHCNYNQQSNAYFPYGVIYLSKKDALIKFKTFYQENTIPYVIERWQNYEVDDLFDFLCIENIMRYKRKSND